MSLKGKKIILGITGGIAAYKSAVLTRLLVKEGAEVKVIMTPLAKEFITPLTLATLSKNPILVDFFDPEDGRWNSHVDLGLWADAFVIAPATANTLAKMAHGIADNLLLTTYLSARCPVFVAPAMDLDMFMHPATVQNIYTLSSRGTVIVEPTSGELASGLEGKGRMEEPEVIVRVMDNFFAKQNSQEANPGALRGKTVLLTSGPTLEKIDPVRFISNFSSGKMGIALAKALVEQGAFVHLVSGPVQYSLDINGVDVHKVVSAAEMHDKCTKLFPSCNAAIMAAAVADYTPAKVHEEKLKRSGDEMIIHLQPTRDIAADLGGIKSAHQVIAGFALETSDERENATKKLKKKNLDFIVLNSLNEPGAGFQTDTNKITIIDKNNNSRDYELKHKDEVARDVVRKLIECLEK
jgi:phosphopantothenoylcysteine decarboxylase / phosphopantothenate---cysteine ligase